LDDADTATLIVATEGSVCKSSFIINNCPQNRIGKLDGGILFFSNDVDPSLKPDPFLMLASRIGGMADWPTAIEWMASGDKSGGGDGWGGKRWGRLTIKRLKG
jgi:hypothetical protein